MALLGRAISLGHGPSVYARCVIVLLAGEKGAHEECIEILGNRPKAGLLLFDRNRLIEKLDGLYFVRKRLPKGKCPVFCSEHERVKFKLTVDGFFTTEITHECVRCNVDHEIESIWPWG